MDLGHYRDINKSSQRFRPDPNVTNCHSLELSTGIYTYQLVTTLLAFASLRSKMDTVLGVQYQGGGKLLETMCEKKWIGARKPNVD
jgi:hypothetical protein